jgi:taurine dioxygenase
VIHRPSARRSYAPGGAYADASALTEFAHLAVRVDPETPRKYLFTNPVYSIRFEDWSEEESAPPLDYLRARYVRPEFVCRFAGHADSLAFLDNRAAPHFAVNDYEGHRRHMQSVNLAGDRPFGIKALGA